MVFADASALIAIIVGEPDAVALADALEADRLRLCSSPCPCGRPSRACAAVIRIPSRQRGPMSTASSKRATCNLSASASANSRSPRKPMRIWAKAAIRRT